MPIYYARPATGTRFPVILVNEEIFGVHEYIADVCRRFAKLGYLAVAPEIYVRNRRISRNDRRRQIMREVVCKTPDDRSWRTWTQRWPGPAQNNGGDLSAMGESSAFAAAGGLRGSMPPTTRN